MHIHLAYSAPVDTVSNQSAIRIMVYSASQCVATHRNLGLTLTPGLASKMASYIRLPTLTHGMDTLSPGPAIACQCCLRAPSLFWAPRFGPRFTTVDPMSAHPPRFPVWASSDDHRGPRVSVKAWQGNLHGKCGADWPKFPFKVPVHCRSATWHFIHKDNNTKDSGCHIFSRPRNSVFILFSKPWS